MYVLHCWHNAVNSRVPLQGRIQKFLKEGAQNKNWLNSADGRTREINKNINDLICKNRQNLRKAPLGSREWWKNVDMSQRRCSSAKVSLNKESLYELNDYFADLCWDDECKQPTIAGK